MQFPDTYLLNGSDYFQVFLDKHHRRYGYLGNVSRLVFLVDGSPSWRQLSADILDNEFVQWVSTLRLKTSNFFALPRWQVKGSPLEDIRRHVIDTDNILDASGVFARDINCKIDSPLQFDFIQMPSHGAVVVSWNHILMDARGIELLMREIITGEPVDYFAKDAHLDMPWKERLQAINRVKDFLIPNVKEGISKFAKKKKRGRHDYAVLEFTEEETRKIDEAAKEAKVGIAKSSFYLAAAQRSFKSINSELTPAWIPVPQDQRRKGRRGPIMGNQVSFLFYSLQGDQQDLPTVVWDIRNQMMDQMRSRLQQDYHVMMDSMRRFPAWLYRHLVASPTKGALASYFYSDTGYSLEGITSWAGHRILNATHYPPNSAYPGLTIIFMRYAGRQKVSIAFPDTETERANFHKFASALHDHLLGQ